MSGSSGSARSTHRDGCSRARSRRSSSACCSPLSRRTSARASPRPTRQCAPSCLCASSTSSSQWSLNGPTPCRPSRSPRRWHACACRGARVSGCSTGGHGLGLGTMSLTFRTAHSSSFPSFPSALKSPRSPRFSMSSRSPGRKTLILSMPGMPLRLARMSSIDFSLPSSAEAPLFPLALCAVGCCSSGRSGRSTDCSHICTKSAFSAQPSHFLPLRARNCLSSLLFIEPQSTSFAAAHPSSASSATLAHFRTAMGMWL
mmetsp:Transcript_1224/g.4010  ORF Transcript_1224/g.4010 Transcript_1224/m.4010 type:complete len:258 (-) Transcript_1224:6-779(-)